MIAFFDYGDVFEDFYPHYGVTQREFASRWAHTGNHAFVSVIQESIADVTWYSLSLDPQIRGATHEVVGCRVEFVRSSIAHRALWRMFYTRRWSWRLRNRYRAYALFASYLAPLSSPLIRTLRKDRPDAFLLQDYATGRYDVLLGMARMLQIPVIAMHTGSTLPGFVGIPVRKRTLRRADSLIVSSAAEKEKLIERFNVRAERATVILTPIDTETYMPRDRTEASREAGLDPRRRYILFIGRLDDNVKGISRLIRIFADLSTSHSDIDLVVAGNGPDRETLENLAAMISPERVHFTGWIAKATQKANLYAAAELLVLPSRREGFPTVIGEAMASGTPVVASELAGPAELVQPGVTGWLVEPDNDALLAAAIDTALSDRVSLEQMGRSARELAITRLSHDTVGKQLREVFQRIGVG